jgi:hypothetical protein
MTSDMSLTANAACHSDELVRIEAWRFSSLLKAGYPADIAELLAQRTEVDLHHAIELLEQGCTADLAIRILT